ncbi:hypothetical protein [Kribbella sp. NPDC055071]
MSSYVVGGSTLGVLTRQEITNYSRHKLFWLGAIVTIAFSVGLVIHPGAESSSLYAIVPAAALGLFGLVTMFGLTRRSDRAAEAAGAVVVPERTRTLALAGAVVVPFALALVAYVVAVGVYLASPPDASTVPDGASTAYVAAQMFGDGVMAAVGGPLLGLLLARYLPRRGVAVVSVVVLVLATILLQGNFKGGQPYRVFWIWTYFVGPAGWTPAPDGHSHWVTAPGNPYIWVLYLIVVCALGVVAAVRHDPDSDRTQLNRIAIGLVAVALVLGVLAMTVGFTDTLYNPIPLPD